MFFLPFLFHNATLLICLQTLQIGGNKEHLSIDGCNEDISILVIGEHILLI